MRKLNSVVDNVVGQLSQERTRLVSELNAVTAALTAFGKTYLHGSKNKASGSRKRKPLSAAGKKRIAAAQRARWAKWKAERARK